MAGPFSLPVLLRNDSLGVPVPPRLVALPMGGSHRLLLRDCDADPLHGAGSPRGRESSDPSLSPVLSVGSPLRVGRFAGPRASLPLRFRIPRPALLADAGGAPHARRNPRRRLDPGASNPSPAG